VPLIDQDIRDGLARLPPDFGRGLKLAGMDEKQAILALAATYILDYSGEEKVKASANLQWKRSVLQLDKELHDTERCKPGKENAVIAAMLLFGHNEVGYRS